MRIYLATTSDVKFKQYERIFASLGTAVWHAPPLMSATIEPQLDAGESDPELVVAHPLRQAARFAERYGCIPYVKEDTMLAIDALNMQGAAGIALPGPDTKTWWRQLGSAGILWLLRDTSTRTARYICQMGAYLGQGRYCFERSVLEGVIAPTARTAPEAEVAFPAANPFYFHCLFVPSGGDRTLGEMWGAEFDAVDYRRACAERLLLQIERAGEQRDRQLELTFEHK